jgi:hypothetical protein
VLAFCLGEMRLAPEVMWAATPREVAAMVRGRRRLTHPGAVAAPSRADFAALAALFPDTKDEEATG